jgi:hypothetical protein
MTAFRGVNPGVASYSLREIRPTGSTLAIEGASCEEYTIARRNAEPLRLWLDPACDYIVRRSRQEIGKTLVIQHDIRYRHDDVCGWMPISWVRTDSAADGTPFITRKLEVSSIKLNEPVPANVFEVQFPPGTHVYRGKKHELVQPDGSMREVIPPVEESPPSPEPSRRGGAWYWLAIATAATMLMPYAWLRGIRKRRAKAAGRSA